MKSDGKSYVQCTQCGYIFRIKNKVDLDKMYIKEFCPHCEQETEVLNLGEDKQDKYLLYDVNIDSSYYE